MHFAVVITWFFMSSATAFYSEAECELFVRDLPWYASGKCVPVVVQDLVPPSEGHLAPRKVEDHGQRPHENHHH